jgi:hypothetical protein
MGLFKRKSKLKKLEDAYSKKMEESFLLSAVNRTASDQLYKEAQEILAEIKKEEQLSLK